ncbi:hypothetical protein WICMUC_001126 [Wickerhamomyces mucosus]|uniref:Mitochondrial outer membrane protein IML2 n=1 Tax=Wickerhamomyces mucosus TaxID=1378264 RepID=A0A9P8PXC4_9ASCO|nr:hypothetical protein WICMUC_001126 [Wickerhamomyces mucosus]
MLRVLGIKSKPTEISKDESIPLILKQAHDFEVSLQAMDYLLDDRTNEGLYLIEDDPDSAIKTLAKGVIKFLEATLGFESDVMKKAGEVLTKAEALSTRERSKSQNLNLKTSQNFPPGTEYAVTYAESNLLNALIMLLSESMIESAKALYKLRKAYQTLEEIFKHIKEYEKKTGVKVTNLPNESSSSLTSGLSSINKFADIPFQLTTEQLKEPKLKAIAEKVALMRNARLNGAHIGNSPASERLRSTVGFNNLDEKASPNLTENIIQNNQSTVDEFIISGANLCFGILQLVLSLLPPAIGKVLSIVGFKGSREQGLKMVWKSVQGRNVQGCIGLLGLLIFYDGPFQFTDSDFDIPDFKSKSSVSSELSNLSLQRTRSAKIMKTESKAFQGIGEPTLLHPGQKLEDCLLYARALFPHSALWLLQEARMLTSRGKLEEALNLMESLDRKIEMKQVEALLLFDKVMILIFLHKFERAAETITELLKVNEWSPGLYTYAAGCCYLELYRMCELGLITDKKELNRAGYFKSKAKELILKAPQLSKQGKIMSKQMPFDKFLLRKISQFKHTASQQNVDIIDAIGTSPIHELSYFWNGYNRMPEEHLKLAQKSLNYGISEHAKVPEAENQLMIRNLLQSITLRRLGEITEGREIIDEKVLKYIIQEDDSSPNGVIFIKHTEDPWLYPTALYERALFYWKEHGIEGLEESKKWLRRALDWADDYELSTRIGMKIKAALDRLEVL